MKQIIIFLSILIVASATFASDLADKYPGDSGVHSVKGKKQQKAIEKILESVDVTYEMGDGYYGVESVKLFIVRNDSTVVGYLEEYKLTYSEDPVYVYALVRYNRKGRQVGELEELRREPIE